MDNESAAAITERLFQGLNAKDLTQVPFAPDVIFESPITPKLSGIESVMEFLQGVLSVIKEARLHECKVDGEYVSVRFQLDTVYGLIPVSDCMRIADGQIKELRPYYDPRAL